MKINTKKAIFSLMLVTILFIIFCFFYSKKVCPIAGSALGDSLVDLSSINDNEKILIQVWFSSKTQYGEFSDALYFTQDEFNNTTKDERELKEKERVDKWVKIVSTPPPHQTEESLQTEIDSLNNQLTQFKNPDFIQSQIDNLTAQLSEKQSALQTIINGDQ